MNINTFNFNEEFDFDREWSLALNESKENSLSPDSYQSGTEDSNLSSALATSQEENQSAKQAINPTSLFLKVTSPVKNKENMSPVKEVKTVAETSNSIPLQKTQKKFSRDHKKFEMSKEEEKIVRRLLFNSDTQKQLLVN